MSVACNWVIWNGSHVIVSFSWANFLWAPPPTLCFFLVGLFWLTLLSFVTNVATERATARVLPLLAVGGIGANSPSPPPPPPPPIGSPAPPSPPLPLLHGPCEVNFWTRSWCCRCCSDLIAPKVTFAAWNLFPQFISKASRAFVVLFWFFILIVRSSEYPLLSQIKPYTTQYEVYTLSIGYVTAEIMWE